MYNLTSLLPIYQTLVTSLCSV